MYVLPRAPLPPRLPLHLPAPRARPPRAGRPVVREALYGETRAPICRPVQRVPLLAGVADDPRLNGVVLVTHHVDEIPPGFTHVLLLANGQPLAQGPIGETLTAKLLSNCFGIELKLEQRDGRWLAWGPG